MPDAVSGKRGSLRAYLRCILRRLLRRSLRAIALLFALALSGLLISQFVVYLEEPHPQGKPASLGESGDAVTGFCPNPQPTAVAEVSLHSIDVVVGLIGDGVSLCIPPSLLTELRSAGRLGQPVFREVEHHIVVVPRFAHLAMTVQIYGLLTGALRTRVPFTRLATSTMEPRFFYEQPGERTPSGGEESIPAHLYLENVQLPISGYPENFPLDTYVIGGQMGISLPSGVTLPTSPSGTSTTLPLSVVPTVSTGLRGFRFIDFTEDGRDGTEIHVHVRRSAQAILFSFSLALVPILLMVVLFIVARTTRQAKGLDFLIGSAAILFAVLPIRAVLVPSGLSTLTLIDYLLGWEVGILALFAVWSGTSLLTD
jgi:hypothetical protein